MDSVFAAASDSLAAPCEARAASGERRNSKHLGTQHVLRFRRSPDATRRLPAGDAASLEFAASPRQPSCVSSFVFVPSCRTRYLRRLPVLDRLFFAGLTFFRLAGRYAASNVSRSPRTQSSAVTLAEHGPAISDPPAMALIARARRAVSQRTNSLRRRSLRRGACGSRHRSGATSRACAVELRIAEVDLQERQDGWPSPRDSWCAATSRSRRRGPRPAERHALGGAWQSRHRCRRRRRPRARASGRASSRTAGPGSRGRGRLPWRLRRA